MVIGFIQSAKIQRYTTGKGLQLVGKSQPFFIATILQPDKKIQVLQLGLSYNVRSIPQNGTSHAEQEAKETLPLSPNISSHDAESFQIIHITWPRIRL